ncbi:MAG: DUF934 domain-containing protein [Pseudomonadota bacterium]
MTIVVRDGAFHPDDLAAAEADGRFHWRDLADLASDKDVPPGEVGLRLANDVEPDAIRPHFTHVSAIAIAFPAFSDGRGFGIGRWLRRLGYIGRLRAEGHVIADQYPLALACGFDEVAIDGDLAARQDASQWRLPRQGLPSYQDRLQASA